MVQNLYFIFLQVSWTFYYTPIDRHKLHQAVKIAAP